MTSVTLHEGDNREHLRRLIDQGVRVHSVVTDPPYGLTSVVKRFGKEGSVAAKHGTDGAFSRASAGFMGKAWDGTGIERDPEFWRLIWEILLPGGFVFAFSGSRTGHWQACAMETAGFIIHPMHGWVYGSGFPKAHNAALAIDKSLGHSDRGRAIPMASSNLPVGRYAEEKLTSNPVDTYESRTDTSASWQGWAYGTQSQKPALEPIYLGQKPFSEKTGAANLLKHGVGAFNIDACRVPGMDVISNHSRGAESAVSKGIFGDSCAQETHQTPGQALGRWPANLLHDNSPEVVALFPDSKGQIAKASTSDTQRAGQNTYGVMARGPNGSEPRADTGSAARFFNSFPDGPDADTLIYHSKASKVDRAGSKHPTVKPIGLMEHLIKHITPPGGVVLDPFAGSGTTAEAARRLGFNAILMEQDPDYATFLRQRFELEQEIDLLADLFEPADDIDLFADVFQRAS